MLSLPLRSLAPALLVAAIAPAQQVLVVDQQNGPGTDFVDLPAAVAAASPGATLQVRPGGYTGFVTDKGIQILGGPGVFLQRLPQANGPVVTIAGVPAGETFQMRDVAVTAFSSTPLRVDSCAGRVLLEGVRARGLSVVDADQVELRRGRYAISALNSTLSIDGHDITGDPNFGNPFGVCSLQQCECILTDSYLEGGGGAPAIWMQGGTLSISMRRPGSVIRSGQPFGLPRASIAGFGSVRLDPNSVLEGFTPGSTTPVSPAISGPTVQMVDLPALRSEGGAIGETFSSEIAGLGGQPYLMLLGSPTRPVAVPGVGGSLWLRDPVVLSGGVFGSSSVEAVASAIPNAPILIGLPVARQLLTLDQAGGLQLSNPATYVIRP